MLNFLYSALYSIVLTFLLPFEYLKRPRELRGRWIRERFGLLDPSIATHNAPLIWVHAVSVGEAIASASLIKKLKERHPSLDIVISTVTDTGRKVAMERMGDSAGIIYVPFDLPFAIHNTVKRIRPSAFIIMETELWPNTIRILSELNIPVLLLNGRISERSFNGYKKLKFFIKDVLKKVSLLCMQEGVYADRIRSLGAEPERVRVIGSFKFDTRPSAPVPEWTKALKGPVIIAGSTHRTEEDVVLDAYIKLKNDFPRLNLIIAPRHPGRFKEVEELVERRGLEYVKRSEISRQSIAGSPKAVFDENAIDDRRSPADDRRASGGLVVILDVMGELSSVYGASDIAVMGGSFIGHGGQNPLEPAYWERAIVCGPHMENFPFIDNFYKSKGALEADSSNLYKILKDLLDSPDRMSDMGKVAKGLYEKNAGATERAVEIIEKYL